MIPFYLKKWYFDLITPEGDALYFYFITARIAGVARGIVSAHLIGSAGREVRAIEKAPFAPEAASGLRLGRHAFFHRGGGVEVRLTFKNLSLDLAYAPRVAPWRPTPSGVLLKKDGGITKKLRWHVPMPSARVEGAIAVDGVKTAVAGDGYLDVVETDIPPWRLPLAELQWGRAHFPDQTLVFNQVRTRQGKFIRNLLLAETRPGSASGQQPAFDDQSFNLQADPRDITTSLRREGAFGLLLTDPKVIEESPVVTAERFKLKSARRALERLTGGPREKKMVSRARLTFNGTTASGTALHERVSWHWREEQCP